MKILIPLTILVLSFIIYFFFSTPQKTMPKEQIPLDTKTLSDIQPEKDTKTRYISGENISLPTSSAVQTLDDLKVETETPQSSQNMGKEYLTLDDLKKYIKDKKSDTINHTPIKKDSP